MKKTQIIKGLIVLVVVWAIIAAGVYLFSKNDVVAPQTTEVNPDMQNEITAVIDRGQVVRGLNAASYDFSEEADGYWEMIQKEYTNRDPQVVKEKENRHDEFKEYIISELKAAGFSDEDIALDKHTETTVMNDDLHAVNIIATLEGREPDKQVILIGGYDGVYSPGRTEITDSDDGSSAALMLACATGIMKSGEKPQYTVKFVFGDGEAQGDRGSAWFARTMRKPEVQKTVFAVRLKSSADKVYGDKLGECQITGGVIDKDNNLINDEALNYAKAHSAALGLKAAVQDPDPDNMCPFSEYGVEYVDIATDMGGNTVKLAAAMIMGAK